MLLYYISYRTQFRGTESVRRDRLLEKIAEAARCGVDYIQLREKDLPARELEALAGEAVIPRAPRQVTEPRQRGIISPLHIINHYEQRTALSPIRAQPVQPVKRREPVRRRLTRLHSQRPRTHPCNPHKQPTPRPRRSCPQHRLEQLTRNPERDLLLKLRPARPQHSKPTLLPARPRRHQQLALANPSRTLHQNDRPGTGRYLVKHAIDMRQLDLTL